MNITSRVTAILETKTLATSVTGIQTFDICELELKSGLDSLLPTNLRLGQMVEKVVGELIRSSSNYDVLFENIQITKAKQTIGELDFIIENTQTKQLIHLELAYKFYLLDPHISTEFIHNWIGPNRNDSLVEKIQKLKEKQFPLLYHDRTKAILSTLEIDTISQKLCLLASLFIPYGYKDNIHPDYEKAIKGYYVNFETFVKLHHVTQKYHIPSKKEWGIDPSENKTWATLDDLENEIHERLKEKRSLLCWQKQNDTYECFFIVWW